MHTEIKYRKISKDKNGHMQLIDYCVELIVLCIATSWVYEYSNELVQNLIQVCQQRYLKHIICPTQSHININ